MFQKKSITYRSDTKGRYEEHAYLRDGGTSMLLVGIAVQLSPGQARLSVGNGESDEEWPINEHLMETDGVTLAELVNLGFGFVWGMIENE